MDWLQCTAHVWQLLYDQPQLNSQTGTLDPTQPFRFVQQPPMTTTAMHSATWCYKKTCLLTMPCLPYAAQGTTIQPALTSRRGLACVCAFTQKMHALVFYTCTHHGRETWVPVQSIKQAPTLNRLGTKPTTSTSGTGCNSLLATTDSRGVMDGVN